MSVQERESAIAQELRRFVQVEVMRDNELVELHEPLFETGRVDSLGLLQIVEHIGREFGVDLLHRGRPADLQTLATLAQAILRERGAA